MVARLRDLGANFMQMLIRKKEPDIKIASALILEQNNKLMDKVIEQQKEISFLRSCIKDLSGKFKKKKETFN